MSGRIRTIKPELLEDEKAAALSDAAWRLFVSSWLLADDHGRFRAGARYLAAMVWQDTARAGLAGEALVELARAGRVRVYQVAGDTYAEIPTWAKHQRIDNAGRSRLPNPPSFQSVASSNSAHLDSVSPRTSANLREPPRLADFSAGSGGSPQGSRKSPLAGARGRSPDPDLDLCEAPRSGRDPDPDPDPNHRASSSSGQGPEPGGSEPAVAGIGGSGSSKPQTAGPGSQQGEQPKDPGPATAPPPVAPLELLPAEAPKPSPAELVFAAFLDGRQRLMSGTRPPKLDDKRRKLIAARLRDFPLEDVIGAARGIWLSAWHVEDIPRRVSLELALRDSAHVEKFRDIASRPELGRDHAHVGLQRPAKPGEFQWKRTPGA